MDILIHCFSLGQNLTQAELEDMYILRYVYHKELASVIVGFG